MGARCQASKLKCSRIAFLGFNNPIGGAKHLVGDFVAGGTANGVSREQHAGVLQVHVAQAIRLLALVQHAVFKQLRATGGIGNC